MLIVILQLAGSPGNLVIAIKRVCRSERSAVCPLKVDFITPLVDHLSIVAVEHSMLSKSGLPPGLGIASLFEALTMLSKSGLFTG